MKVSNEITLGVCASAEMYVSDVHSVVCTDIDECQTSPCEYNCTNTIGSFECSCPAGFEVASDGLACDGKKYPFRIDVDSIAS